MAAGWLVVWLWFGGFGVGGSRRRCLFALVVSVVCLYVCGCAVGCCLLYLAFVWVVFSGYVCWWWLLCHLFCSLALLGVGRVVIF